MGPDGCRGVCVCMYSAERENEQPRTTNNDEKEAITTPRSTTSLVGSSPLFLLFSSFHPSRAGSVQKALDLCIT